jgi:parvulin-like peptidyl-prolyl isomerase
MKEMTLLNLRNLSFLLLAGIFLLFIGCGKKSAQEKSPAFDLGDLEKNNNIVLKIGGSSYFNSDFERYVQATMGDDYQSLSAVSLSRLFDNFTEEKILLQAAQNLNLTLTSEEKKLYLEKLSNEFKSGNSKVSIDELDTKILFDRLLIQKYTYELVRGVEVQDQEIKDYYRIHKKEFLHPERVKVSQILLDSEDKAIEVYERVKGGSEEGFKEAARKESLGLEGPKGGEMGIFEMGQLPFEMERVIFSLKEGEISPVVESLYGYHIFRLDKKYGAELVSEEDAVPQIKTKLLNQKIKDRLSEHIEELKKNLEWAVYPQNLSFPYQKESL